MTRFILRFLTLFSVLFSLSANAGLIANPLPELAYSFDKNDFRISYRSMWRAYLGPNEFFPARMLRVTSSAPEGVYVGVGTERCLMAAAINSQLSFLVLADHDINALIYNRINLALLRLAKNREHYLHLRLEGSLEEWRADRSDSAGNNRDEEDVALLFQPSAYQWWQDHVASIRSVVLGGDLARFQMDPSTYEKANYLFDDSLFERVANLAKNGKIQVMKLELNDKEDIQKLHRALSDRKMHLSIFDLSNCWQEKWGVEKYRLYKLAKKLRSVSDSKTLLLGTADAGFVDQLEGVPEISSPELKVELLRDFTYFGARIESFDKFENWKKFENLLEDWDEYVPLSSEIEKIDPHLQEDWRQQDVRSHFTQIHDKWFKNSM